MNFKYLSFKKSSIKRSFLIYFTVFTITCMCLFSFVQVSYAEDLGDIVTGIANRHLSGTEFSFDPEEKTGLNIGAHIALGNYGNDDGFAAINIIGPTDSKGMKAALNYIDSQSEHTSIETKKIKNCEIRKYTFDTPGIGIGVVLPDYYLLVEIHDSGNSQDTDFKVAINISQEVLNKMEDAGYLSQTAPEIKEVIDKGSSEKTDAKKSDKEEYTSGKPIGDSEEISDTMNIYAVNNGPTEATIFSIGEPHLITRIHTYHWNDANGAKPGTIGLQDENGRMYGPWKATGTDGQGGVPNANWEVFPNIVIPAGNYTIIDSDPDTWSVNSQSEGRGMGIVDATPHFETDTKSDEKAKDEDSKSQKTQDSEKNGQTEIHDHSPAGVGSVGNIPGPSNTGEAVVGVVVPGIVATALGVLSGLGGGGITPPSAPFTPTGGGSSPMGSSPGSSDSYGGGQASNTFTSRRREDEYSMDSELKPQVNEFKNDDFKIDENIFIDTEEMLGDNSILIQENLGEVIPFEFDHLDIDVSSLDTSIDSDLPENTFFSFSPEDNVVYTNKELLSKSEDVNIDISAFDESGYDVDGYDVNGFDKQGFDEAGFDKTGYDVEGYDVNGFDKQGFDEAGFDKSGYDVDGYDVNGFDKQGFDEAGFDKSGYDVDGYDVNGFDRQGFDEAGFDKSGYDVEGYDVNGFDRQGFDEAGFDKSGYDVEGYDVNGFDRQGFDEAGFDKSGYDVEGYDVNGFDKAGYDEAGYDISGYDKDGYDFAGYDKRGFDEAGYDKQGYDELGYDVDGYDVNGYDKLGYDEAGYDISGYDKEGYDYAGYDKQGFDKTGYDVDGYDINGFDKSGYDVNGFDKQGYDESGYDIFGYDKDGYDYAGYNKQGFDKSGYDESGYDVNGFNKKGYDQEGYGRNGFDAEGYDRSGYDINGYDRKGYNKLGYDSKGFNKEGYDKNGFNKNGWDKDGYGRDGFNDKGYDREGYDKKGYDVEGYDRDGYDKDGYTKQGLDDRGYGEDGFNEDGFDKDGFDREGYNFEGYDRSGYDPWGYNRQGYGKDGYHWSGYNADGYNRNGRHWSQLDYDPNNRNPFDGGPISLDGSPIVDDVPKKPPLGEPYYKTKERYGAKPWDDNIPETKAEKEIPKPEDSGIIGPEDPHNTLESHTIPDEPEWQEIQVTPRGATIIIEKDPETGEWINKETGNPFDLEAHKKNFPQQVKEYEDFIKHNEELERTGQSAMQQALDEIREEQRKAQEEAEILDWLKRIKNSAERTGLNKTGEIDDMYTRIEKEIEKVRSGEKPDIDKAIRVRDYIVGRTIGYYGNEKDLTPERFWGWTNRDLWTEAIGETGRNISMVSNKDGSFSWGGFLGRLGIGALTLGKSEKVFIPMSGLYAAKDAIDKGSTSLGAIYEGIKHAGSQYLTGKLMSTGFSGGLGTAKGAWSGVQGATGGFRSGIVGGLKGGLKGGSEAMKQAGRQMVQEVTDVFSKQAWQSTAQGAVNSVKSGAGRISNILTGKEGYTGISGGTSSSSMGLTSSQLSKLSPAERNTFNQIKNAIDSGDPRRITNLYRNNGMENLSALQQKGVIPKEVAQQLNRTLGNQVNNSIQTGTRDSIREMQRVAKVRIEEVVVGDSGSSARGGLVRLGTDFDRTVIPRFNQADLARYASQNNMSAEQAYNSLCRQYAEIHCRSVDNALTGAGLNSRSVGYATYDRIGAASGHADSYSAGFTNARQATMGRGQVYRVNADGSVRNPYNISGESVVDRNILNNAEYGGNIPANPTAIRPEEVQGIIRQQIRSINNNPNDPIGIAKAIGRTEKGANILRGSLGDSRLTRAAKEIYDNPGLQDDILKKYGFVDSLNNPDIESFCQSGRNAINGFDRILNS